MLSRIMTAIRGKKTYAVVVAFLTFLAAKHFNFEVSNDVFYLLGALGLATVRDAISKLQSGDFTDIRKIITEEIGSLISKTK